MAYQKQAWEDLPSTNTPITSTRLNHMEDGIYEASQSQVVNSYNTSSADSYSASYINGLNTYSTTEKRVGTWIDNKPLYRIVIETTDSQYLVNNASYDISSLNVDTLVNYQGALDMTIGNNLYKSRNPYYVASDDYWVLFERANSMQIRISNANAQCSRLQIILLYTKTTD